MAVWWAFRCYCSLAGIDVIDEWYQAQPDKLKAKFDTRMRYLQQQPRSAWVRPYFDTLSGDCAGLGEVRFEWKNVQYRPIGFSSGQLEFTLVMIAIERGRKFEPLSACKIAHTRKAEIAANRKRAHDCEFD